MSGVRRCVAGKIYKPSDSTIVHTYIQCIYSLLLGLGYHEDLRTRTSFIEVLTSILKEGAQFSSLAETALADRLNHMLELVTAETTDGELPLVMALIDSVPPEHVVSIHVYICPCLVLSCICGVIHKASHSQEIRVKTAKLVPRLLP